MPFPTTPVLDNFNRANEGPPPSASWSSDDISTALGSQLEVVSSAYCTSIVDNTWRGGAWGTQFGPNCEVYMTMQQWPANNYRSVFWLRLQNIGTNTPDGYNIQFRRLDGNPGFDVQVYRSDDGVQTLIGATYSNFDGVVSGGSKIGANMIDDTIDVYFNSSGSWSSLITRTDATYNVAGYIGISTQDSFTTIWDDFGGGTIIPFPTTGILDNFDRTDEGPPPSASWGDSINGAFGLKVASNVCAAEDFNGSGWWNTSVGPDSEAYATISTATTDTNLVQFSLRLQSPGGSGVSGYRMRFYGAVGQLNSYIYRVDSGVSTQLGSNGVSIGVPANGDMAGASVIGTVITSYYARSGVWGQEYQQSDSTYTSAGYVGLWLGDTTCRMDDFGGGTIAGGPTGNEYIETGSGVIG